MLKITILLDKLLSKHLRISGNKINRFDIDSGKKITRKSKKLKS